MSRHNGASAPVASDARWLRRLRRRRRLVSAAAALLASGPQAACRQDPGTHTARGGAPNLVLVLVDTVRQDHLRAYGYARETAPTLTRLVAEGARLDGLSPTSWTKPAVASLFTGLHPLRHQVVGLHDSLPQAARTLAERLRQRGYDTLGVTANGFSSARYAMEQGFRELVYLADVGHTPFATADEVDQEAVARLGTLRPPYFLFVHYLDPHAPYEAPAWGDRWPLRRGKTVRIEDLEMETFFERPGRFRRAAVDAYDAEIRRADAALGRLLRRLSEGARPDQTLTVVLSDHGEEFEEHGRMGHGQTLYEEVLRVPLVFHWPGRIPAGTRHGTVSLLDVAPTVLDLLGVAFDASDVDGLSVAASLTAGRPFEGRARALLLHLDVTRSHYLALRRDDAKLLVGRYPHRKELFDLRRDPGERSNLLEAPGAPASFTPLARGLAAAHRGLVTRSLPRVTVTASDARRQSLAALGYVDAAGAQGGERRGIPPRVEAPDPDPAGRLGWETPGAFQACLDLASPAAADQLLGGWFAAEAGGRWTWPEATVLLARPRAPPLRLRVAGVRKDTVGGRLRVSVDGRAVLEAAVPQGPFELQAALPAQDADDARASLALVTFARTPAYVPAAPAPAGAPAAADHRRLGVFLSSVCLEPARVR